MSRKVKNTLFIIMLITTILFSYNGVYAYDYLGGSWYDPDLGFYYDSQLSTYIKNAALAGAADWNSAGLNNASLQYSYGSEVYVTEKYEDDGEYDGEAILYPPYSGDYISATIVMNTYWTDDYGSLKVESVMCHEMGHVFGLADVGNNNPYIMNGNSYRRYDVYGIYTPQQYDVNAVNALY